MQLLAGIYVYDGKLVSLYKGDLDNVSTYRETPLHFAEYIKREGLNSINFVDLNASLKHELVNEDLLKSIIRLGINVQYAGGVRDMQTLDKLFSLGVHQVVLGVSATALVPEAIRLYGTEKIVLGIKTKYDQLISDKEENINVLDYSETHIASSKAEYVSFSDVLSSGVMIHPNYDIVEKIALLSGKKLYIRGGVSESKHITILKNTGVFGVIIGKAFYERKLSVKAALRACGQ